MASASHKTSVAVKQQEVWEFVKNMEKWAKLVPGYREHKMISDTQSTWKFAGSVGKISKTVEVQIDITSIQEPTKISFNLTGLSDKFAGTGFFVAQSINEDNTEMEGHLDIKAGGIAGAVLNPLFLAVLPKATSVLTERVANKIVAITV